MNIGVINAIWDLDSMIIDMSLETMSNDTKSTNYTHNAQGNIIII